jgi:hypothetical protein
MTDFFVMPAHMLADSDFVDTGYAANNLSFDTIQRPPARGQQPSYLRRR